MTTETQHTKTITTAQLVERLSRFDGPPEQFLRALLTVQCRLVAAAAAGVVRPGEDGQPQILALWPEQNATAAPEWMTALRDSIINVLADGQTCSVPLRRPDDLYGTPASRHAILLSLKSDNRIRGVAAFMIDSRDPLVINTCRERLELTAPLLSLYEMQLTLQKRQIQMQQLASSLETTAAVNEHDRFTAAAMALVNDLAVRWRCQRAAIGILRGRYVRLRALSHTEKFSRKMQLIGDIESAMEECLDQDLEILTPPQAEARYVYRSADVLNKQHGPACILSMPLRNKGECVGVLTLQRASDQPFTPAEVQTLRLTADLAWPHVYQLSEHDRWFGAKLAGSSRKAMAAMVGPKHTWIKAIAIGVLALAIYAFAGKGEWQAEAPFLVTVDSMRSVHAPFKGILKDANLRLGDEIAKGGILARLDDRDLQYQLDDARAQVERYNKEADQAESDKKLADAQIARARARQAEAQAKLLDYRIEQSVIRSPVRGIIVSGDLRQVRGSPVEQGNVLFEIAPLEDIRGEVLVDERDIDPVREDNMRGELATLGDPGRRIGFTVEHVDPVASVENGANVFKVRVRLDAVPEGLKLRQTGVARINLGEKPHYWLWTHRATEWVRMKLWW